MKKHFLILFSLVFISFGFSQNSKSWKGYFSYREIKDLSEAPNKIFAASENALFTKELLSGSIKTINTVDGLSGQTITSIYHSEIFKKTLVGYDNGLIIVINEIDGSMLNVVDIINKALPPNIKKVNHFMEYEGIAYVSCDFGIVQYNLATLQFGDTYFIGDNGGQIIIKQTAVFQNKIYAAGLNNGIRSADIANPNLNDFNQWTTIVGSGWTGIETFSDKMVAVNTNGNLQLFNGTTFTGVTQLQQSAVDLRKNGDVLIVTTPDHVYLFGPTLVQLRNLSSSEIPDLNVKFSCATVINDLIYMGTIEDGVLTMPIVSGTYGDITPDGPVLNNIFAIASSSNKLWAVYGDYEISYNPFTPVLNEYGISKFTTGVGWSYIPPTELFGAKALVRIAINPVNENQVYVSSYQHGLLKIENDIPVILYDENNTGSTGLESISPTESIVRINGSAFDKSGNLWVTNSLVVKGLKVLKPNNSWLEYDLGATISDLGGFDIGRLTIDKNGTKWLVTRKEGLIGFNESYGNLIKNLRDRVDLGNLPSIDARVATVDKRNQLWIGTRKGLRVLSSVDNFTSAQQQLTADPIIIIEEDLAQELLYEQFIVDIVVDGSNNKWIGTADSGVFYVSSNGQQTIYQFNTGNSPLPSNVINDIEINGTTGEVFFATIKGMVSFKGISTEASNNLNNVYIYPNPVRPEFTGTVKVSGLIDNATVKIADIEGNLVYETVSIGGTIEWDTTAFGKYKVASGVYMVFISADDGTQTKVKKVMIVR